MTHLDDLDLKRYLPSYRLPRLFACFFMILLVFFMLGLLLMVVAGPLLIDYISERDPVPALDMRLGETVALRDFEIHFARIDNTCIQLTIHLFEQLENLCLPVDDQASSIPFLGTNFVRAEPLSEREIRLFFI
ncbi:MAG: hypothetical protein WBC91_19470, partial [Phototrophicaceae bacterium]